jgi:menaquinone-specific isochorismate synthase
MKGANTCDTRVSDRPADVATPFGFDSPEERTMADRLPDATTSPGRAPDTTAFATPSRGREADVTTLRGRSSDGELLEAGLAAARAGRGFTCVVFPAPIVSAASVIGAWRTSPCVAWSSRELTIVGVGVAHELRGTGEARWNEIVAGARQLVVGKIVGEIAEASAALARPRFLGGVAFATGAAERPPWTGFGDAWFMLPRWMYVHDGARGYLVLAIDARDARHGERWRAELAAFRTAFAAGFATRPQPPMVDFDGGDPDAWRAQVRAITSAIEHGECEKVVAARSAVVTLGGDVRPADLLAELDARHGECVRLVVRPPTGGALLAATPERLVRVAGATIACDALAGSRARLEADGGSGPIANHHWLTPSRASESLAGALNIDEVAKAALLASGKDHREHELVVRAIANTLAELGDVNVPDRPQIRALRHVLHLHTPITATLHSPRHVLEVAARLHPTPAVGGTPTRFATDWITERELAPRGWYAAPVGWFDLEGNGELAVAIRSGLLAGDRAHLWAGAGIVAGSDPDKELAETELKLRAMLGALGVAA